MYDGSFLLFYGSALVYGMFAFFLIPKIRYCKMQTSKAAAPQKGSVQPSDSLSIIIPARNEAGRITQLLDSLQKEGAFQRWEVLLADDESSDATATIARNYGCTIVPVSNKAPEAIGKSWACAQAAASAKGTYLLFLDADTTFNPGGLERILDTYTDGLLSVQPYHRFYRFHESFSAFFNLLSLAGINSFSLHSHKKSAMGAFGPCILCSKTDYQLCGGHMAIAEALVDDMALGRLFREKGFTVHNYAGKGSIEYRMYPEGFHSLWTGWMKNMGTASAISSKLSSLYFALWCAGVANIGLSFSAAESTAALLLLCPALYALYVVQLLFLLRKIGNWKIQHMLFFPIYLIFFIILLLASLIKTGIFGHADWSGRRIQLRKKRNTQKEHIPKA